MIEALADAEHASWARWMAHLFSRARSGPGFTKHISYDDVTRWQRQIDTPYADLTEREKQSDRDEVAHILPIINAPIAALEGERDRLLGWQAGQPHYIGCWRAHRKCAIDTVEFEVARRERAEAERDAAVARAEAASPFALRMRDALERLEQWRSVQPNGVLPLADDERIPHWCALMPTAGEARRLVGAVNV